MKPDTKLLSKPYVPALADRLVRYARLETTSDRHSDETPSTACQWELSRLLASELAALGVRDIELDGLCYLMARLPASKGLEGKPTIGFMAHVDTSSDVSGKDVKPRLVADYDGGDIALSPGCALSPKAFAELSDYRGDTLVVTDGTTLLGADDKAGIAEIMTLVAELAERPELPHGPIEIIFTPDEETGKGMNRFPVSRLKSKACYTLDGGRKGEIEAECFNAEEAVVTFEGVSSHPGYARGVMANAVSMAAAYASMLPRSESPEATDGWYGYYHAHEIRGGLETARLDILLRDYSDDGMKRREDACLSFAKAVEAQFPGGKANVAFVKQYLNMRRKLDESPKALELLFKAAAKAGAEPYSKPIRGGTDGARLTEMGIPTPNVFAGMHNFHSRFEWASVTEMATAVETLIELVKLWAE